MYLDYAIEHCFDAKSLQNTMQLLDNAVMFKIAASRSTSLFAILFMTLFSGFLVAQQQSEEILIDVRSQQEFRQGHLQGAINIPFMQIMRQISEVTADKQTRIRLYCSDGSRAEIARQILESMNFENVVTE